MLWLVFVVFADFDPIITGLAIKRSFFVEFGLPREFAGDFLNLISQRSATERNSTDKPHFEQAIPINNPISHKY